MSRGTSRVLECPRGWVWMEAGTAIDKVPLSGKKLKQSDYQKQGALPVIDQGRAFIGGYTDRAELKAPCEPPVIVFGDHTKVLKYVEVHFVAGADGVKAIKPLDAFLPKLFYYFLQAVELPEKGYARHFQFLERSSIPLPPFAEQQRIVSKIEELLTRLDAGVEALTKIKTQLKRYRQAILKHAFEGKLTAEWRQAHKDELEPASALLERIKEERHESAKGNYKHLPPLDTSALPDLPEGWAWTRLGEIVQAVEKASPRTAPDEGFTYVDIASIAGQRIVAPKWYLGREAPSRARQLVKAGDVLFSTVRTYLKHIAIVDQKYSGQIASTGFCVIRLWPCIDSRLVFYLVQTDTFLNPMTQMQRGTSYPAVRDSDVLMQPLAVPSLAEQRHIVQGIERRFSVADQIEKTVDQALKQAERLRRSILKKAFEGKLVPQDPKDEPAAKLLERIRAERAEQQAGTKSARAAREKATTQETRLT